MNAGGTWAKSDDTWSGITETSTAFAVGAATVVPNAANSSIHGSGFIGGGQIGCNYQASVWVLGGEADFQYTGLDTTRTAVSVALTTIVPGNISESFSSHWLSTIRGRLAYASGAWLLYGTGGLAIANVSYSHLICFPTAAIPICNTASSSSTRAGWTAGAGLEWIGASRPSTLCQSRRHHE